MTTTHTSGAADLPDAPKSTAADGETELFNFPGHPLMVRAVDFNRLHGQLAALAAGQAVAPAEPTPDELRAIAREARNSSGSASDDCGSAMYVLYGWRAAISKAAQQAPAGATSPWSRALEIRIAQGWKLKGDRLPVLYTDTINGDGVGRDDLWLCTTSALAVLAAPSATASFQGRVERHSDQSVLVVFPSCRLASEFERSLLPAFPTIEGESNG